MPRPTFFLRRYQNKTKLAITKIATTGPAITPGLTPPPPALGFLLHWIAGHWEHVLGYQLLSSYLLLKKTYRDVNTQFSSAAQLHVGFSLSHETHCREWSSKPR